jgi:glycosyltransferase involved in cell wall biosynthesis
MKHIESGDWPPVSIIIPVYNRETLVVQAVESALAQTYTNIEVIVVDDGSVDNTFSNLQSFVPSIVLYRKAHGGQSSARNLGWKQCGGKYVLFLDSDDVLEPDAVENLRASLEDYADHDPRWGLSYGKMITCDEQLREVKSRKRKYLSGTVLPELFFDNFVRTGTYLVRRSILDDIKGFKEDLLVKEDRLLLFLIAANHKFAFVDKVVTRYRRHRGHRARQNSKSILEQGTRHLDYFFCEAGGVMPEVARVKDKVYAKEYMHLSKIAWRNGFPDQFRLYWKRACAHDRKCVLNPRNLVRALTSSLKQ